MIQLDLTIEETQTLMALIDAGVRSAGIRAVTAEAVSLRIKLEQAADTTPKSNVDSK